MFYKEYEPAEELKKFILCFWSLEFDYRDPGHTHEQLWADTHSELIFGYGIPYVRHHNNTKEPLPHNILIGPFKEPLYLHSSGITGFVAVRFQPWGVGHILNTPVTGIINNVTDINSTLNPTAIPKGLNNNQSREEKIEVLNQHFINFFKNITPYKSQSIAEEIAQKKGVVNITELSEQYKLNNRQLERLFLKEIGMSAKIFARISRFVHAKQQIENNPDISLTQLTYESGYADQAHFTKNFKELFHITPARFKKDMKEVYAKYNS